ncbi:MAG: PQQ-binding-like beta-propeller repeat protein, partial [Planctomycetota bacterium]|nr:PQQ-binding-like beta-propeller repeat protein [Planctomycetota bacterium]
MWGYDPTDGRELWNCRYEGYSVIPRPVTKNGVVFVCTGYDAASLMAIRLGGQGDITNSHLAWRYAQGVPFTPSPVIVGDYIYLVSDNGILSCVTLGGGQLEWKQRLGGNYSASPICVEDRLYCQSEEGVTHVVRVGPKFEKLSTN